MASTGPMRCCHCCSSSSNTSGTGCPRRTAVQRAPAPLGAAVSPLLWGVRQQQPSRPQYDDGHYMLDKTKPLYLAPVALQTDDTTTVAATALSTAGGWPTTVVAANAVAAAQWRPSFFQCCYSYASGVLWQRPPMGNRSSSRQNEDDVARIGARSSSSDDVW